MINLIGFRALVDREVLRFTSVFKQTIFPPLISSFLYISIFGLTLGSRMQPVDGVSYLSFLIPGLVMMYLIEGSYNNTSSSLFIARWGGHIQEILVTPLSYVEMVFALLIGGLIRGVVVSTGVFLVSLIFVKTPIMHPFLVLTIAFFVSLSFSAIGAIVALIAEEFEHISICTTFVITPLIFFGGVFNSIEMLPDVLQGFVRFNPIFYMVNGMRYSLMGVSDIPIATSLVVVIGLFCVLFTATVLLFRAGFKLRK